jgi:hypothetical protein
MATTLLAIPRSLIPEHVASPPKRSRRRAAEMDAMDTEETMDTEAVDAPVVSSPNSVDAPASPLPVASPSPAIPIEDAPPAAAPQAEDALIEDAPPAAAPLAEDAATLERTKTLRELRQMCTDRELPSTGKKAELAKRLASPDDARS